MKCREDIRVYTIIQLIVQPQRTIIKYNSKWMSVCRCDPAALGQMAAQWIRDKDKQDNAMAITFNGGISTDKETMVV
jgi:hypothetical protein